MQSNLLQSMLQNLSEEDRIKFLKETFESLPEDQQAQLLAELVNGKTPAVKKSEPFSENSPQPFPKKPEIKAPQSKDVDHLTKSLSLQFESERKPGFKQMFSCMVWVAGGITLILAIALAIKYGLNMFSAYLEVPK